MLGVDNIEIVIGNIVIGNIVIGRGRGRRSDRKQSYRSYWILHWRDKLGAVDRISIRMDVNRSIVDDSIFLFSYFVNSAEPVR